MIPSRSRSRTLARYAPPRVDVEVHRVDARVGLLAGMSDSRRSFVPTRKDQELVESRPGLVKRPSRSRWPS
jgi:hypothetical protein